MRLSIQLNFSLYYYELQMTETELKQPLDALLRLMTVTSFR